MGWPSSERIRERLAEESLYAALQKVERVGASRNRWVVPMQENNREKWSFLPKNGGKDKQGGTTGVFVQSLSSLLQCFGKGRGFFYCPAPDVRSIKSASFNQKESAPSAHLRGIPYELMARRDAIAASMEKG